MILKSKFFDFKIIIYHEIFSEKLLHNINKKRSHYAVIRYNEIFSHMLSHSRNQA